MPSGREGFHGSLQVERNRKQGTGYAFPQRWGRLLTQQQEDKAPPLLTHPPTTDPRLLGRTNKSLPSCGSQSREEQTGKYSMTDVVLLVIYYAIRSLLSTEMSHVSSEHTGGATARCAWGPLGRPQRHQPCPPRAQSSWRGGSRKGRWTVILRASSPPFCRSNAPAHCGWDNHFIRPPTAEMQASGQAADHGHSGLALV